MDVTLEPGENTFENVDWDMNNSFIIGYTFTDVIIAGLDSSPTSENSMVFLVVAGTHGLIMKPIFSQGNGA